MLEIILQSEIIIKIHKDNLLKLAVTENLRDNFIHKLDISIMAFNRLVEKYKKLINNF